MMSLSLRIAPVQKQEIRLTQSQRLTIKNHILGLRIDLAGALAGVNYRPENSCPSCNYQLKLTEILKGYSSDPTDLRTQCPKCRTRFEAQLRSNISNFGFASLRWYCPSQALYALQDGGSREMLKPEEIKEWNQSVYHSLLTHFGSLTNAFKRLGITYTHSEVPDWNERVKPFLGKLPDTVIAKVVGVGANIINALRKSFGVPAFNRRKLVSELS